MTAESAGLYASPSQFLPQQRHDAIVFDCPGPYRTALKDVDTMLCGKRGDGSITEWRIGIRFLDHGKFAIETFP